MIPLLVIRPEPGCASTVSAARAIGLTAHAAPLFTIRANPWEAPNPQDFDAVVLGSANALRYAGAHLDRFRHLPVYAVGEATAAAARAAGLTVTVTGNGFLQNTVNQLAPAHRRLLRLTGTERVSVNLPPDVSMAEHAVYTTDPLPLAEAAQDLLAEPAAVALHSAVAAAHFAGECVRTGLARADISLIALSQRIAQAAGPDWRETGVAAQPTDAALLALALQMCQDR